MKRLRRLTIFQFVLTMAAGLAASRNAQAQSAAPEASSAVAIPGGTAGIGFDDLRFSPALGKVLAPAGRTGSVALIDPGSHQVVMIGGFSAKPTYGGGHDESVTSADYANGSIFATDRTSERIEVVDPAAGKIVAGSEARRQPRLRPVRRIDGRSLGHRARLGTHRDLSARGQAPAAHPRRISPCSRGP